MILFIKPIRRSFIFATLFACLFTAGNIFAQFESATVLGTVRDTNEAVVAGATVKLTNPQTGIITTTRTDSNGDYQFINVKIGTYRVSAEAENFSTTVADKVDVAVNARQRIDLVLSAGSLSETVMVTNAAQLLETDSSSRGQIINRTQIVNLPLNGRSAADLALLAPGVRASSINGSVSPGREGSFNVNGLRSVFNNFLLDGIDNNAYGTSNQGFSNQVVQVSPDAVAEFKVETNTYSAEFGRSAGAIVNASYRSGTNQFHGSLWEFNRNTALNAVGFFKPAGGVKPTLIRNQFGLTLGGPIIRDQTFFFVDYEGFRQIQKQLVFSTVPELDQRNGILAVTVRDPVTGAVYPAGTQIPMTEFASKVLNELPAPNIGGTNAPGTTRANNFSALVLNQAFNDKFNVKLDHKISDQVNVFARVSHRKSNAFEAPNIPGPSGSNQNGFVNILNQQLVGGVTYVLKNASVFEARLGISKIEAGKRPPLSGGPSVADLYGITGLPTDPTITGGLTTQTISGFSQLGRQSTNPQFQNPFSVNPRFNYAWTHGRHSLKTGYEFLLVNTEVQDTNPLNGLDTYAGQFTRPAGAAANNLYNLADFFFGYRSQYELANALVLDVRQRLQFAYLQDDFKFSPKLTLNLGLRYEFSTPLYEEENRLSNYDPVTNSVIQAKDGSLYDRALVDPDYNNFAPRFGFAYNIFDKTVIRGGYGIGYVYFNRLGSANLLATNTPQITRATITQGAPSAANPLCAENNFTGCFRTTTEGYPTGLPNTVTLYLPRDTPTGYVQNWQLSIQREIAPNTIIDLAYIGNHAVKLILLADYNQARPPLPGENVGATLQARRPIEGFGSISAGLPAGFSNYHSLQIKLERRFSTGFYLLSSFTWSKAIDNVGQSLEEPNGNTANPQNLYDLAADYGISAFDQPINSTTSAVWEIPIGRGRAYGSNLPSAIDALIGGWTINGINTMTSGQPINLRYGPSPVTANLATFLGGTALRPNIIGDPVTQDDRPNPILNYFQVDNVLLPNPTQPFGNAGRNIARSNAFFQLDMGIQKQFALPINETTKLELRAEFFNLLNKTNFLAANPDRSSAGFGAITGTFPARQIQLALKVHF